VFLFPATEHLPPSEVAFRSKTVGSFILRTHQADVSIQYGVAEGERQNFKSPPKMSVESLPIIMCLDDWRDAKPFILRGTADCQTKEELLHPSEWKTLCEANGSFLPSSYTTVPVKKRTFRELMAMSKGSSAPNSPTKMMSPIKVEPKSSSSSSSSSSTGAFSPLFKKN
jgi:hypothetical protein